MNILAAIVIIICIFIACVFGSAAAVMISREIADRKLKKQNELNDEIERLREECYEDNKKLNERMTTLSINQNILEENLKNFLNK